MQRTALVTGEMAELTGDRDSVGPSLTNPTFAERFAQAWSAPTPERLVDLLHPNVVLYQPWAPTIHGRAAALREFRRLFAWLPDLHGIVERSSQTGEVVFIEWQMRFPTGREMVSVKAIDRFVLQGGLGIERTVCFDQFNFLAAIIGHPSLWPGYVRYRFGTQPAWPA